MTWYNGLLIVVCLIALWYGYDNGYMVQQAKRARTFIGSGIGKQNFFSFQFTGCTGHISRVMRVQESGMYTVTLNADLSNGAVRFLLYDGAKTLRMTLTPELNQGKIQLEKGQRYHIRMEFDHASGDSKASWEKE